MYNEKKSSKNIHSKKKQNVMFNFFQSQHTSGVMYFLCSGVMFISMLCLIGVPETGKKSLTDTIEKKEKIYEQSRQSHDRVKTNETKDNKGFECEFSSHL